ncbi:MAG TPA: tetratricopeptide repeat protein, partial [Bacteroidetes bacterium]|nr:tetratricopeptide repeat protein [Bacteroidota bacterium]
ADLLSLYALPAAFWVVRTSSRCRLAPGAGLAGAALFAGLISVGPQLAVQHREDASIRRFVRQLERNPERSAYGWEVLGQHYRRGGDLAREEEAFRNATRTSDSPRYPIRLAQIALQQQRYGEAENYLRQALARDSTQALTWGMLGKTRLLLGDDEQGIAFLRKAVDLEPENPVHYANLALARLQLGEATAAAKVVSLGIRRCRPTPRLYYVLGLIEDRRGNTREALAAFQRVISLEAESPWSDRARQQIDRLMRMPPPSP